MPSLTAISTGIALFGLGIAVRSLVAGPSPPTVAEVLDLAYCQGWDRAAANLTERAAVIRTLYPDDDKWAVVRDVMDIGECPRAKPRIIGQPLTPPPAR